MRKFIICLFVALLPISAFCQGHITTKKLKIADATSKTVKVVLTGSQFYDEILKEEVMTRWHISPFEFCTADEFETFKKSSDFYFLINLILPEGKKDGPGINWLYFLKGGQEKDKEGIDGMLEVVSLPFCPAENANGRELVFLPAFLDIIQDYTLSSMEDDKDGYGGLGVFACGLKKTSEMDLLMSEEDMSEEVKNINFPEYNIIPANEDESYGRMQDNAPQTLITYTVTADGAPAGTYCYKYIIDSGTHTLHWFKKHKMTKKTGAGFQMMDIDLIRAERKVW